MIDSDRQRPARAGWIAALASALAFVAPATAQAEITSVFDGTATPVDCTVQGGANEGIRYCSQQSERAKRALRMQA